MWFVLIKSWSKYAKQNKTLKLEFCEETSSATCAIFAFAFERRSDFRSGKSYFAIFAKTKVVSITVTLR